MPSGAVGAGCLQAEIDVLYPLMDKELGEQGREASKRSIEEHNKIEVRIRAMHGRWPAAHELVSRGPEQGPWTQREASATHAPKSSTATASLSQAPSTIVSAELPLPAHRCRSVPACPQQPWVCCRYGERSPSRQHAATARHRSSGSHRECYTSLTTWLALPNTTAIAAFLYSCYQSHRSTLTAPPRSPTTPPWSHISKIYL